MESSNTFTVHGKVTKMEVSYYENNVPGLKQEQEIEGSAVTMKIEQYQINETKSFENQPIDEGENLYNCEICKKDFFYKKQYQ